MSTKECPSCAVEIDKNNEVCPICGYEFPVGRKLNIKIVALIMLLLLLYPIIRFLLNIITR